MKRFEVVFDWDNNTTYTEICLGYSKKELLEFMCPYVRKRIVSIKPLPQLTQYRIDADALPKNQFSFTQRSTGGNSFFKHR